MCLLSYLSFCDSTVTCSCSSRSLLSSAPCVCWNLSLSCWTSCCWVRSADIPADSRSRANLSASCARRLNCKNHHAGAYSNSRDNWFIEERVGKPHPSLPRACAARSAPFAAALDPGLPTPFKNYRGPDQHLKFTETKIIMRLSHSNLVFLCSNLVFSANSFCNSRRVPRSTTSSFSLASACCCCWPLSESS